MERFTVQEEELEEWFKLYVGQHYSMITSFLMSCYLSACRTSEQWWYLPCPIHSTRWAHIDIPLFGRHSSVVPTSMSTAVASGESTLGTAAFRWPVHLCICQEGVGLFKSLGYWAGDTLPSCSVKYWSRSGIRSGFLGAERRYRKDLASTYKKLRPSPVTVS